MQKLPLQRNMCSFNLKSNTRNVFACDNELKSLKFSKETTCISMKDKD